MIRGVYLVHALMTRSYKIGYTNNISKRISQLQTGCPFKLFKTIIIKGNNKTESKLHDIFASNRSVGEWFEFDKDVIGIVKDIFKTINNEKLLFNNIDKFNKINHTNWNEWVWESKNGSIDITNMGNDHLINTINMINKNVKIGAWEYPPCYDNMHSVLYARGINVDGVID